MLDLRTQATPQLFVQIRPPHNPTLPRSLAQHPSLPGIDAATPSSVASLEHSLGRPQLAKSYERVGPDRNADPARGGLVRAIDNHDLVAGLFERDCRAQTTNPGAHHDDSHVRSVSIETD